MVKISIDYDREFRAEIKVIKIRLRDFAI